MQCKVHLGLLNKKDPPEASVMKTMTVYFLLYDRPTDLNDLTATSWINGHICCLSISLGSESFMINVIFMTVICLGRSMSQAIDRRSPFQS